MNTRYTLIARLRKNGTVWHEIKAVSASELPDGVGFNTKWELKAYLQMDNIKRKRVGNDD